jgi:hypothetical protein
MLKNIGMYVALAADGGGIAQLTGYTLDRCDDVLLCIGFRTEGVERLKHAAGENAARSGAKVFGGEVVRSNFAKVAVDLCGVDTVAGTSLVHILK